MMIINSLFLCLLNTHTHTHREKLTDKTRTSIYYMKPSNGWLHLQHSTKNIQTWSNSSVWYKSNKCNTYWIVSVAVTNSYTIEVNSICTLHQCKWSPKALTCVSTSEITFLLLTLFFPHSLTLICTAQAHKRTYTHARTHTYTQTVAVKPQNQLLR